MPPLPSVNKVIKAIAYFSDPNGHNYENVYHFGWTGPATAQNSDCNSLSQYLWDAYNSSWMTLCSEDFTLLGCKARDLTSASGAVGQYNSSLAGSESSGLAPSVAVCISWLGGPAFRGGHPRTYLPGVALSLLNTDGTFMSGAIGGAENMVTYVTDTIPAETYPNISGVYPCWVNYHTGFTAIENPITHRYRNVPNLNSVPPVHAITGGTVTNKQRSQRRRLRPSPVLD